jgi:hypothetical protein
MHLSPVEALLAVATLSTTFLAEMFAFGIDLKGTP